MVLRNALEHMLVAIELIHDDAALAKWMEEEQDEDQTRDREHHFKPRTCVRRIDSPGELYSALERELAKHVFEEWKKISNQTVHLHSRHQVEKLLDGSGGFQFLGLKQAEKYERDFHTLARILFDITIIMLGMPCLREAVGKSRTFHDLYHRVYRNCMIGGKAFLEVKSKTELKDALARLRLDLDVSALPSSANLGNVQVDMTDPLDPKLLVDYLRDDAAIESEADDGPSTGAT